MPYDAAQAVSRRTAELGEAVIQHMAQRARALQAAGRSIVNLSIGEPDFATPVHICEAAGRAIADGFTHYAPIAGFPELREAIARKLRDENRLDYQAAEIVVSNGAKQAITNAAFATLDPLDEVILVAPFWSSYEQIASLAGGSPVVLKTQSEDGFKLRPEDLARALTPRSKLLILNAPGNPSGTLYEASELQALAAEVAAHPRLLVISDEVYEYFAYEGQPTSFATLAGMRARTITVNGFSKGFAMTGWRLGYAAAPLAIATAMAKIQGAFTAGANAFVQKAAVAALTGGRRDVETMRAVYRRRRDLVTRALAAIEGVRFVPPPGSFYAFPDVSALLPASDGGQRLDTVDQLCDWLLDVHGVAVVPGSSFGDQGCFRISFAASDEALAEGLSRIGRALATLDRGSRQARNAGS
jgi:aspartate aminotransferase